MIEYGFMDGVFEFKTALITDCPSNLGGQAFQPLNLQDDIVVLHQMRFLDDHLATLAGDVGNADLGRPIWPDFAMSIKAPLQSVQSPALIHIGQLHLSDSGR